MNNNTLSRSRLPLFVALLIAVAVAGLSLGLRRIQAQAAQPTAVPAPVTFEARVDVSSLNLRTGPHVSYTAVAYLVDGEQVKLVGRNRAATWAQVELYNGYRGWVNARYLQPGVNIAALPVADVALLGITAFVTNDSIPVYAGPDALYQRVGTGQPGDVLTLDGRNDAATWVHVSLPGGPAGWARADSPFLPSASIHDLPIITPFLDAPPPELSAFYRVYAGPGFLYEPVDSVVEGQTLGIRGRSDDARWLLVRLENGREGWIAAEILRVDMALEAVPVIEGVAPPQVVGWQMSSPSSAAATATATSAPPTATGPMPATATAEATTGGKGTAPSPATATPGATPTGGGKGTAPNLDTATPAPGATATATTAPTERATAQPTARATATRPATPTPAPTVAPTATTAPTQPPPTAAATTTTPPQTTGNPPPTGLPVVYVYATPSDANAPILRVVPGQSVVLIGRTADSEWVRIWLPGDQQGWIRASAVQVEIDLAVLPVVAP
ncbi:MAG TPA: SH3 domain-containing protein [Promineifilum sp.]|nr:SH3 domain-containing protein [Promineifilum sp.]